MATIMDTTNLQMDSIQSILEKCKKRLLVKMLRGSFGVMHPHLVGDCGQTSYFFFFDDMISEQMQLNQEENTELSNLINRQCEIKIEDVHHCLWKDLMEHLWNIVGNLEQIIRHSKEKKSFLFFLQVALVYIKPKIGGEETLLDWCKYSLLPVQKGCGIQELHRCLTSAKKSHHHHKNKKKKNK